MPTYLVAVARVATGNNETAHVRVVVNDPVLIASVAVPAHPGEGDACALSKFRVYLGKLSKHLLLLVRGDEGLASLLAERRIGRRDTAGLE